MLGIVQGAALSGNREASGLIDCIIYGLVDNFRGSCGASVPSIQVDSRALQRMICLYLASSAITHAY